MVATRKVFSLVLVLVLGIGALPAVAQPDETAFTLEAVADATTNLQDPDNNEGDSALLRVMPDQFQSYIRFPEVDAEITSAVLRLHRIGRHRGEAPAVYETSSDWEEDSITSGNAPPPSGPAFPVHQETDDVIEFDVTGLSTMSVVVVGDDRTRRFSSREGREAPELDVRVEQPVTDVEPPTGEILIEAGAEVTATESVSLGLSASDDVGVTEMRLANGTDLSGAAWQPFETSVSDWSLAADADGTRVVSAQFKDAAGNVSTTAYDEILLDTTPPEFLDSTGDVTHPEEEGSVTITAEVADAVEVAEVTLHLAPAGATDFDQEPMTLDEGSGLWTAEFAPGGDYDYYVRATDTATNSATDPAGAPTETYGIVVQETDPGGGPRAPNPTPADPTVVSTFPDAFTFLHEGPDATQVDVEPDAIVPERAAIVRGRVVDREGDPVSSARVSVLDQSQVGYTLSRADGVFDLAVNGGGDLVVSFEHDDYLGVQRRVEVPWHDIVSLPDDVALTPLDPHATTITLPSSTAQVARGSVSTDADGTRQGTLIFQPATSAEMLLPDGSTQPLSTMDVRVTEYTVGDDGPEAMPGDLPPTSGYTYAAEYSVDEAIAAGATEVRFDPAAVSYTEDFVGFPVGIGVPVGSYDREAGLWVPSADGVVLEIVGVSDGLAEVDLDGDGTADDPTPRGITDEERARLADLYDIGERLWRVPVPHFSPWDKNWPIQPPDDALFPDGDSPDNGDPRPDDPCERSGSSVIACQTQILGETIALSGTDQDLHYRSDRGRGRTAESFVEIELTGDEVPQSVSEVALDIQVAGQHVRQRHPADPNQRVTFAWDGLDVYGRELYGPQPIRIRVGWVYPAAYARASSGSGDGGGSGSGGGAVSFNNPPGGAIEGSLSREEITFFRDWESTVEANRPAVGSLDKWSLTDHHSYDPNSETLFQGNGEVRRSITPIAGNTLTRVTHSTTGTLVEGVHASDSAFRATGIDVSPDGTIYAAAPDDQRVVAIDPDGIVRFVAGDGTPGYSGDGGPALEAQLNVPSAVRQGPDGSLYVRDRASSTHHDGPTSLLVRRIRPDGTIETLAGGGDLLAHQNPDFVGSATALAFGGMPFGGFAVGADGAVYLGDSASKAIWQISPDGTAVRVVGNGTCCFGDRGEGLAPLEAQTDAGHVEVAPDGSLVLIEGGRVRQVQGVVRTLVGTGFCPSEPAESAPFDPATAVCGLDSMAFGPGGVRYIGTTVGQLYAVGPDDVMNWFAGGSAGALNPDRVLARDGRVNHFRSLRIHPDGGILFITSSGTIMKIVRQFPEFQSDGYVVPSADGLETFAFASSGRHLRTIDTLTGAVVRRFGYDPDGRLATVTDVDGDVTTIERDADGVASAIEGPFGRTSTLTVTDGLLREVTDPTGAAWTLGYDTGELLTEVTDPRGAGSSYAYDNRGRLVSATSRGGGSTSLARTERGSQAYEVAVTRDSETTTYGVADEEAHRVRTTVDPTGAVTELRTGQDGTVTASFPDGSVATYKNGSDPRFGPAVSTIAGYTYTTPDGVETTADVTTSAVIPDPLRPTEFDLFQQTIQLDDSFVESTFDRATRTIRTTSPRGRVSTVTLDESGRVVEEDPPGSVSPFTYGYDAHGRLETVGQGGETVTYEYDESGDLVAAIDGDGGTWTWTYDAAGRMTAVTAPSGRKTALDLDANGNISTVTMPDGSVHEQTYDDNDQRVDYVAPGASALTQLFDGHRRREGVAYPDGTTRDDLYEDGLPVGADLPDGAVSATYAAAADGGSTGVLDGITRTPASGSPQALDRTLDGGLVTGLTWSGPASAEVEFDWERPYRLSSRTMAGQEPIAFTFDTDNLLTGIGPFTMTRDLATGLPVAITDGTAAQALSFDDGGDLTERVLSHDTAGALYELSVDRDDRGRMVQREETVDGDTVTWHYEYDADGRVTRVADDSGATVESYAYDLNGNRETANGTDASYDDADKLISRAGIPYGYDANGYLATRGNDTFAYTADGALASATVGGETVDYDHDGFGRRVTRTDDDGTTVYVYGNQDQHYQVTASVDAAGVVTEYVYDDAGVLFALRRDGSWYHVGTDQVGSPRVVADAQGDVVREITYSSYGEVLTDSDPSFDLPVGFAGGLADPLTELVRFGQRDYEPEAGRWTARDPILYAGLAFNLYEYVGSDPVNFVDPTGLLTIGGSAYAGFGAGIEVTLTDQGIGVCVEGGVGAGGGVDVNPFSTTQPELGTSVAAGVGVGPFGTGLEVPFDDCWASGRGLNTSWDGVGVGGERGDFGRGVGDLLRESVKKPKLGLQAKLGIKGCVPFSF